MSALASIDAVSEESDEADAALSMPLLTAVDVPLALLALAWQHAELKPRRAAWLKGAGEAVLALGEQARASLRAEMQQWAQGELAARAAAAAATAAAAAAAAAAEAAAAEAAAAAAPPPKGGAAGKGGKEAAAAQGKAGAAAGKGATAAGAGVSSGKPAADATASDDGGAAEVAAIASCVLSDCERVIAEEGRRFAAALVLAARLYGPAEAQAQLLTHSAPAPTEGTPQPAAAAGKAPPGSPTGAKGAAKADAAAKSAVQASRSGAGAASGAAAGKGAPRSSLSPLRIGQPASSGSLLSDALGAATPSPLPLPPAAGKPAQTGASQQPRAPGEVSVEDEVTIAAFREGCDAVIGKLAAWLAAPGLRPGTTSQSAAPGEVGDEAE
jgi:hypothetical protein